MKRFFSYYGGKHALVKKYPAPEYKKIIEPFAGSAAYATAYGESRAVDLYDLSPIVCGVWQYLIKVSREEILRIPDLILHVDNLVGWPQEVTWLVGFCLNVASSTPYKEATYWSILGDTWSRFRYRIAAQVDKIRHWRVFNASYETASNEVATWFVDPPHQCAAGRAYKFNAVDFPKLGAWCRDRGGQTVVCEQYGADWLPFEPLCSARGATRRTMEAIWTGRNVLSNRSVTEK